MHGGHCVTIRPARDVREHASSCKQDQTSSTTTPIQWCSGRVHVWLLYLIDLHQLNRFGFVVGLELKQHRERTHKPAYPPVTNQTSTFQLLTAMSTTNQFQIPTYQCQLPTHINHPASHINVNYRTNLATAATVRVSNCCEFHASLDALCMAHPIIGPYATCSQASTTESCLTQSCIHGPAGRHSAQCSWPPSSQR